MGNVTYACETAFEPPDYHNNNPNYSFYEYSFYKAAESPTIARHQLILRKNLKDGVFEIVRHYWLGKKVDQDEVAFSSSDIE